MASIVRDCEALADYIVRQCHGDDPQDAALRRAQTQKLRECAQELRRLDVAL